MSADAMKRAAAARALEYVKPNMKLGLGTGSTAAHFVDLLGAKVKAGLKVVGVPTSEATRVQAEGLGIPLTNLEETPALDITIDGADEVGPDLTLVKGGGGALLREKIVAAASQQMIVIADDTKWVKTLGKFALPIEVVPFGLGATTRAVEEAVGGKPCTLRKGKDGLAFVTDGGHFIIDAAMGEIIDPPALAARLNMIPGVVETGLFVGMASVVVLAGAEGVRVVERSSGFPL